jgi:5-(carboxyamino)imidazole ribonucleotide mutase
MSNTIKPVVGIVMGSDSDWPLVRKAAELLREFDVPCETRVISAHRTPAAASAYASSAEARGLRVIIAAAGGAAHLGGVLAAHTILPVLGIPIAGGALNGLDALLAIVQMPAGIPVGTVTLGSAGPVNAALLAVQILAVADPDLRVKLHGYKAALQRKVEEGDARVAAEILQAAKG